MITLLKSKGQINNLNRAQLVDDIMNLARAQKVDYKLALDLLLYLKFETEFIPWEAALRAVSYLYTRMESSDQNLALLKAFILDLAENRYKTLGYAPQDENEKHLTILGRKSANRWLCRYV